LYDVFFGDHFSYMVMEKCTSGIYGAMESMAELNERSVGSMLSQMLVAVAHCHKVGVIHRDVKPDNFLVGGKDGQTVKLTDFGLATMIPKSGRVTGVYGTAPFMCPEMLISRVYDVKADVWAIGVIAYILLFGQFPYMSEPMTSKAMKQCIKDCTSLPKFLPVATKQRTSSMRTSDAVSFVKRLLSRDPSFRPTAEEALSMPWMAASTQGVHQVGVELPSLRPMIMAGKKIGAFDAKAHEIVKEEPIDLTLSKLQMEQQGRPLSATTVTATTATTVAQVKSSAGKDWDNISNNSTATPKSNPSDVTGTASDMSVAPAWSKCQSDTNLCL